MNDFIVWLTLPVHDIWGILFVLICATPLSILAAYLGYIYQRFAWMVNHPYADRVRAFVRK